MVFPSGKPVIVDRRRWSETVEAATSIVLRQQDSDYPRRDRGVRRILRTISTGLVVIIDLHPDFAFTVEDRGEVMPGTVGREFAVATCFEQPGQIGRAPVCTPGTNAHLVFSSLVETTQQ